MAQLKYGQKWTIYTLMATHPTTANDDGKSQLRVDIEKDANGAPDLQPSLVKIANAQLGLNIAPADVGSLPQNFTAQQLRNALGFSPDDYDPNMGPCPDSSTQTGTGAKIDNQKAIGKALIAMFGPEPA